MRWAAFFRFPAPRKKKLQLGGEFTERSGARRTRSPSNEGQGPRRDDVPRRRVIDESRQPLSSRSQAKQRAGIPRTRSSASRVFVQEPCGAGLPRDGGAGDRTGCLTRR